MSENKRIKIITEHWREDDFNLLGTYRSLGGYEGLKKALEMGAARIVEEVIISGLQGRGGAGYPTGEKMKAVAAEIAEEKYVICNLDEAEPGTFKDQRLAEVAPHQVIEGIMIAALACGASRGFIYLNFNYKNVLLKLERAIAEARVAKIIGKNIFGSKFDFELEIFVGAGAYICGEETALINSMEGKRGEPKFRPPYICSQGLFGKPTLLLNAETFANVPWIIKNGGKAYAKVGLPKSPGTKLFSVDGEVKHPGVYEAPMGTTLRELIFDYAGGMKEGKKLWLVQVGGAAGGLVLAGDIDELLGYLPDSQIKIGPGTLLVLDRTADIKRYLLSWISFFQRESCGKCVPCREGTFRLKSIVERLVNGNFDSNDREDLHKIVWTLDNTSFCLLGKFSVAALKDIIRLRLIDELK